MSQLKTFLKTDKSTRFFTFLLYLFNLNDLLFISFLSFSVFVFKGLKGCPLHFNWLGGGIIGEPISSDNVSALGLSSSRMYSQQHFVSILSAPWIVTITTTEELIQTLSIHAFWFLLKTYFEHLILSSRFGPKDWKCSRVYHVSLQKSVAINRILVQCIYLNIIYPLQGCNCTRYGLSADIYTNAENRKIVKQGRSLDIHWIYNIRK